MAAPQKQKINEPAGRHMAFRDAAGFWALRIKS